jgi:tRNA pseudouridine38-40 synthase
MLPVDIRLLQVTDAEPDFHARRSARAKTYQYNINTGPVQMPTERLYAAHVFGELDVNAMEQGLEVLVGTHDFSSFEAAGSRDPEIKTGRGAVRTLLEARCKKGRSADRLTFTFTGDGFLRHMVRNIVGTILEVGKGKIGPEQIPEILASKDRGLAGPTAPPQGLLLQKVHY